MLEIRSVACVKNVLRFQLYGNERNHLIEVRWAGSHDIEGLHRALERAATSLLELTKREAPTDAH
jgi:hypothetical protein